MPHEIKRAKMPVISFKVDFTYQRPLDPNWIKKNLPLFDPDSVGVIHVSDRGPNGFWVIDGQHRVGLIRQTGKPWATQAYHCQIYSGLTIQEEAALFSRLNNKRSVPAMAKFKGDLVAGFPWAVELQKVCGKWGRSIGNGTTSFDCVQKLKTISAWKDGLTILDLVLQVASPIYPDQRIRAEILGGLAWILRKFGEKVNKKHLSQILERNPNQDRMIGEAKMMNRPRVDLGVAEIIIRRYNNRIEVKLPSIDASETK